MWPDLLVAIASGWPGALVLAYSVGVQLLYLALGLLAFLDARRERHEQRVADRLSLFEGDLAPPISVLAPGATTTSIWLTASRPACYWSRTTGSGPSVTR